MERFNRTLAIQVVVLTGEHQKDWDEHLPLVLWAYCSVVQESTQLTPAVDLLFRASPQLDLSTKPEMEYFISLCDRLWMLG